MLTIPSPEKTFGNTKSYQPPYIYSLCPLRNPRETHLRSCRTDHYPISTEGTGVLSTRDVDRRTRDVDRTSLLTQDIDDSFSAKKAGAVFVYQIDRDRLYLTAAYDSVWHRDLACKLLRLLSARHMVCMIMQELVGNRSFTITSDNNKRSRLRRLKKCLPQESGLATLSRTSTLLTCQPLSPGSMHTPTISQTRMLMETGKQWKEWSGKTWQPGWILTDIEVEYYKGSVVSLPPQQQRN